MFLASFLVKFSERQGALIFLPWAVAWSSFWGSAVVVFVALAHWLFKLFLSELLDFFFGVLKMFYLSFGPCN